MFSLCQITLSAVVGVAVSAAALLLYQRLAKSDRPGGSRSAWPLAVVVGLSIPCGPATIGMDLIRPGTR